MTLRLRKIKIASDYNLKRLCDNLRRNKFLDCKKSLVGTLLFRRKRNHHCQKTSADNHHHHENTDCKNYDIHNFLFPLASDNEIKP